MANVFKQQQSVNNNPNRNNFDLSFQNHLTMKFGTLYPVFCKEVVPGDSFRIESAFGLKFMPMVFPVQSRMRAHMHFFYVRNKNLWKNWEDWISGHRSSDEHPHPYLNRPKSDFISSSIYDYLGVPTTLVGSGSSNLPLTYFTRPDTRGSFAAYFGALDSSSSEQTLTLSENQRAFFYFGTPLGSHPIIQVGSPLLIMQDSLVSFIASIFGGSFPQNLLCFLYKRNSDGSLSPLFDSSYYLVLIRRGTSFLVSSISRLTQEDISSAFSNNNVYFALVSNSSTTPVTTGLLPIEAAGVSTFVANVPQGFVEYTTSPLDIYGGSDGQLRLNALPFRAYESIYNAFYRNTINQPFVLNGEKQYNKYITTDDDGADSTAYHLYQRNYELDFLTSCLPSPQQGVAPLVGMTALGDVTIEDENGITTAHAEIDNDGTISKVTLTSPAASVEHARTAMNIATAGMSINDFRNVNALQRFLETNIRKGYRYLDFIAGHFGKSPKYNELDMPEFIGGFSRDVNVSSVVSTTDTFGIGSEADSGAHLGDFVGSANAFGGSNHSINHYCDDFGFIMGILCVTPEPAYQQLLPKHFLRSTNLDYYFPEFSQIGMQPVTYEEVMPLQRATDALYDSSKKLTDTFGYQRPNYDLVSSVNEVHGDFRGSLRNFLINRIFSHSPELGTEFLEINPDEINDIFQYTDVDHDPIIGQVVFKCFAKRPVPRVVIPNLGK